jgi:hypothetical protein
MRYFSATAQGGQLYVSVFNGAPIYRTAEDVGSMFNEHRDRCVHSVEELDEVLWESIERLLPLGIVYLAEGLEEEARRRASAQSCLKLEPEPVI